MGIHSYMAYCDKCRMFCSRLKRLQLLEDITVCVLSDEFSFIIYKKSEISEKTTLIQQAIVFLLRLHMGMVKDWNIRGQRI